MADPVGGIRGKWGIDVDVTPARSMSSREFNQGTGDAKRAARDGPVYVTDRGRPSHVLLSYDHYRRLVGGRSNLVDMLCGTPGAGDVDFEIPDIEDSARPASLD